jgi:hypothetical protein
MNVLATPPGARSAEASPRRSVNPRLSISVVDEMSSAMADPKVHTYQVTDIDIPDAWKERIAETLNLCEEARAAHAKSAAKVMLLWSQLIDVFSTYKDEQTAVAYAQQALDAQLRAAAIELGWDSSTPKWQFHTTEMMFGVLKELSNEDEGGDGETGPANLARDSKPDQRRADSLAE